MGIELLGMAKKRYWELTRDASLSLTAAEIEGGWHFCREWDGLLIHKSHPEFDACICHSESGILDEAVEYIRGLVSRAKESSE